MKWLLTGEREVDARGNPKWGTQATGACLRFLAKNFVSFQRQCMDLQHQRSSYLKYRNPISWLDTVTQKMLEVAQKSMS
jgi:hypothetical protein